MNLSLSDIHHTITSSLLGRDIIIITSFLDASSPRSFFIFLQNKLSENNLLKHVCYFGQQKSIRFFTAASIHLSNHEKNEQCVHQIKIPTLVSISKCTVCRCALYSPLNIWRIISCEREANYFKDIHVMRRRW